jgi:integrase
LANLSLRKDRERLAKRPDAYWQRLREGAYLGFRRGPDTWQARWRDRQGKQHYQPLGEGLDFDDAKREAEKWLQQVTSSAVRQPKRGTVKAALERYLRDLREQGRTAAAADAESKFKTVVWDDPFAELSLESLTIDDTLEWRARLQQGRANRSVNRLYRGVKAGLNRAKKLGHVGNAEAWSIGALADDVEDAETTETAIFLDPAQRRAIIRAADANAAVFLQALECTGARPGEMAAATVADLTGDSLKLSHRKGRSSKVRSRYVFLDEEDAAFFKRQAKNKLPSAPLFTEDGVQPWRRHRWGGAMRAAIKAVNAKARGAKRIPATASAYSFRHARISELLQIHNIDPLTVAAQCGTGIAMIEKAYLKFILSAMKAKLAAVRGGD